MTRRPTPDIMDAVLVADVAPDRTALRTRLRWDYSQVAPVDRKAVEDAAVDILANGQRMQESAVAIGERLIAVKRLLEHGTFSDWCSTEFSMSVRTAQNLMNVAREFAGKSETVSLLTDSAMYLLAAPSTPPAAREQAIDEAQATGKSPTKERVREIIAQHKPGPVPQPIPQPTAKEYSAAVQAAQPARAYWTPAAPPVPGWDEADDTEYKALLPTWQQPAGQFNSIVELGHITRRRVAERLSLERMDNLRHSLMERRRELWLEERRQERERSSAISNQQSPISNPAPATVDVLPPSDAPLPGWAEETDDRIVGYSVLDDIALREQADLAAIDPRLPAAQRLMALYGAVIDSEEEYGQLTGRFSDTLAMKRELTHMISHLADLIAIIQHPEEPA